MAGPEGAAMRLIAYLPDSWLRALRTRGPMTLRIAAANVLWERDAAELRATVEDTARWFIG